jgi:hypothetical protein
MSFSGHFFQSVALRRSRAVKLRPCFFGCLFCLLSPANRRVMLSNSNSLSTLLLPSGYLSLMEKLC